MKIRHLLTCKKVSLMGLVPILVCQKPLDNPSSKIKMTKQTNIQV